ncbi:MAG: hypothetical protein J7599_01095 [Niabella sp.]|nr:hypothetical protein [Niabella sp.]
MKKTFLLLFAVAGLWKPSLEAQIAISVQGPKIPKIKKEKTAPSTTDNRSADEGPNGDSWFTAIGKFRQGYDPDRAVADDRAFFISPYLDCYAKKHNIDRDKLGYANRRISNTDYDVKNQLKNELPKLAELEREFKRMFPSRPNTGKGFDENPAIWDDILTNRDAYYQCVVADLPDAGDCSRLSDIDKTRVDIYKENMQKTLEQAKSFTTGRGWYVQDFNDGWNEYLRAAISPSERKQFEKKYGHLYACLAGLLDEIAQAAQKTLPLYKPVGYNVHNTAEERILRSGVTDLAQAKVLGTGLMESDWQISKNEFGIPTARFKHGMIYAQYPKTSTDDGFCRIIYVNIVQDYSGGGTYGASHANFIKSEPAGCSGGK